MRIPGPVAIVLRGACMLAALATGPAASARAAASRPTPTVSELTGGMTPGFTPNSYPDGITTAPDGHVWFTEYYGANATTTMVGRGGVGRINDDRTVTELKGGITPGFSAQGGPEAITTGPDGRIWFAEYLDPGWSGCR